ncbi:hypothetical protein ACMATS_06430 [Streptoverticillium reticulum]|uniref:hypothetical protein n=1 Tax=Streptoverticillium reticulum TaxID=1433415 RepID=UPI0039BF2865
MPKTFTVHMTGGPVEVPATILGIRQALPEADRDQFTAEAESAAADELPALLARWAMNIPTEHDAAEEALLQQVAVGDFSGVVFADEITDAYRSAG